MSLDNAKTELMSPLEKAVFSHCLEALTKEDLRIWTRQIYQEIFKRALGPATN